MSHLALFCFNSEPVGAFPRRKPGHPPLRTHTRPFLFRFPFGSTRAGVPLFSVRLYIPLLQFTYSMVCRPSREGHVGKRRVLTSCRSHEGTIRYKNIRRVPYLVKFIEHRCLRIFTHSG